VFKIRNTLVGNGDSDIFFVGVIIRVWYDVARLVYWHFIQLFMPGTLFLPE